MTTINLENWHKDFDEKFAQDTYDPSGTCHCFDIKKFISSLLQAQKDQDRREFVEKLEKIDEVYFNFGPRSARKDLQDLIQSYQTPHTNE